MKLLVYTIGGQKIGIDIQTWDDAMLGGNPAFMVIPDEGSIPTDYVDISSTVYWDQFGGLTTLSLAEIKHEIIKLIPNTPTAQEYLILEGYMNVGINGMTNINNNLTFSSQATPGSLTGVTDTKFNVTGGTIDGNVETTGSFAGASGTLNIDGSLNVGGSSAIGGNSAVGGDETIGGNSTVIGTINNPAVTNSITGSTNLGDGEGIFTGVTDFNLQGKSLVEGTNISLSSDPNSITINADGGGTLTTYNTTNPNTVTTTSITDVLLTGMQFTSVPVGNYFVSFGTSFDHSSNSDNIYTRIYVGGTAVTGSEQHWRRGAAQGNISSTHNYSNFPITLSATSTVEIRWRTDGSTASSENPYMTLIKV